MSKNAQLNGAAVKKDAETPEYGYEAFGNFGVQTQGSFTGYTPGIKSVFFPKGVGTILPANADLLIQVHYAPLPTDETDQSSVNIFFKQPENPINRELQRLAMAPFFLPGGFQSFRIPPEEVTYFHGTRLIPQDISLISVYPHCHYLGKSWEIFAETPTGDTINIIRINDWDFNWQGAYTFNRMKKVPAGSTMHFIAGYDNTVENPFNPNHPPKEVTWGEGTTDEMYLAGIGYVPYQEGDEDIVIGESLTTNIEEVISTSGNQLYLPYPNPANGEVSLSYYLFKSQLISIELFDIKGTLVKTILNQRVSPSGNRKVEFNVSDLAAGLYTIRMSNVEMVLTRPLVISE